MGAGLLFASSFVRRDIPESVSRLQLVQVNDDGSFAMVREQSAVYLENSADMNLESNVDGRAIVDEGLESGVKRYEVLDHEQWQLSNQDWPPGTWRYQARYVIPTQEMVVEAELNSSGVKLNMPELPSAMEDPVLSYNLGDPMLCETAGGRLLADGSLSADGDRWIAGTLISKEQQRRLQVYQEFFKPKEKTQFLSRVLYG